MSWCLLRSWAVFGQLARMLGHGYFLWVNPDGAAVARNATGERITCVCVCVWV